MVFIFNGHQSISMSKKDCYYHNLALFASGLSEITYMHVANTVRLKTYVLMTVQLNDGEVS